MVKPRALEAGGAGRMIEAKIAWFHGESDEVSGTPRILADLREDGEIISRKTVAKTMRKLGLRGVCPKRWKTTTVTDPADTYPPDAVKRQWDTGALNAVWIGDITYLRTWEGWLYLATVIDAHSRRVIGGRSRITCAPTSSRTHYGWRSSCVVNDRPRSCFTRTEELNTPLTRSPGSRRRTPSPDRWAGPGFAGITPWPNRSSQR